MKKYRHKEDNYANFLNLLVRVELIDNRYPVKGCYIWLPFGFKFKEIFFEKIEKSLNEIGYLRYQFPRLIPGASIRRVTTNIADFESGLFWLKKKSGEDLDLFLNPTGECGVYTMFAKWVKREYHLPLRIYQIGPTFRVHHRPDIMLCGDELTNLLEAHSAFPNKIEADKEFSKIYEILKNIHDQMGIPYLALHRPLEGNKPVCSDMISFETFLPSKRTSFNIGVLYNQDQIYSKAFGVQFSDNRGKKKNTFQVTFGISERGIAAILDIHRDHYGLRMLPDFAPIEVVVFPVRDGVNDNAIEKYAVSLKKLLKDKFRILVDLSKGEARKKLFKYREKGIPVRIGVSFVDVKNRTARVYLRTKEDPITDVDILKLNKSMVEYLEDIRATIINESKNYFEQKIAYADNIDKAKKTIKRKLIAKLYWCGSLLCLNKMHKLLPGELIGTEVDKPERGSCMICSKKCYNPSYYARRSASP